MAAADMHAAFLADVCAAPEDDVPRLIYADWCEDNGDEARAAFVRAQVEIWGIAPPGGVAYEALCRRAWVLLGTFGRRWSSGVARACRLGWWGHAGAEEGLPRWIFRRGFVEFVALDGDRWLERADDLVKAAPIREVTLTTWPGEWDGARLTVRCGDRSAVVESPLRAFAVREGLRLLWPRIRFNLPEDA